MRVNECVKLVNKKVRNDESIELMHTAWPNDTLAMDCFVLFPDTKQLVSASNKHQAPALMG